MRHTGHSRQRAPFLSSEPDALALGIETLTRNDAHSGVPESEDLIARESRPDSAWRKVGQRLILALLLSGAAYAMLGGGLPGPLAADRAIPGD